MRVAVTQFATSSNTQENLASCIRIINEVAVCEPSLIVLPEYSNTLFCNAPLYNKQTCYVDHEQAWNEALTIDGAFLQAIAEQAIKHNCYIVINVTLRRDKRSESLKISVKSNISVTSLLFSPLGELIYQVDKQALTEHENEFFISDENIAQLATTPFGQIGFLTGNDEVTFSASRDTLVSGAQLLCHSMGAFDLEQSDIYGPAKAYENNVFLATANKIGSLVCQGQSKRSSYSAVQLGVGQSQIISPDGKVLARIANKAEGFVYADIDLAKAGVDNKVRPDGSKLVKQLRPELYRELLKQIIALPTKKTSEHELGLVTANNQVPSTVNAAIFATYKSNEQAIEDVCHYIENNLSDIIQLPELFFIADKIITNDAEKRDQISCLSKQVIKQVSAVLRPYQYLCTSLVIDEKHQAVLISEHGLLATQQQLHFCQRYQWTALGDDLNIIELPLEQGVINLAMLTADDANIPEIVMVSALHNIHLLLIPFDIQEPGEVEFNLLARATEHRICIVAASREKSFTSDLPKENIKTHTNTYKNKNKIKAQKSTGLIISLSTDYPLSTSLRSKTIDGYVNNPLVKYQHGKITKALIHPLAASKKT